MELLYWTKITNYLFISMYFDYLNCYLICTTCIGCTWTLCHLKILCYRFCENCLNCMPVELDLLSVKLFIPDGVD